MKKSSNRELIVEKAIDHFYKSGYVKASIRDIVRSAGLANSTVYSHFKNKDEILFLIIEHIGLTLINKLEESSRSATDPVEALRNMIFNQICLINNNRKTIKIFIEEQYQLPVQFRKKASKQHRQIYELLKGKVEELIHQGLTRKINPTVVTFCAFAVMNWSYRWFNDRGLLTIEVVADQIISIFLSGILKEDFADLRQIKITR